ncbi:uncharacterized protein TRIADDRAFT_54612 [Trichoplax adhaerens]|uniref:P/Homo B domain-containing protein n=1 Tax=Trichoplax adhaerens TaxID=10228 RepID=B3RSI8_TRIAD|nr:hypothetical protein TRIADDRAFT_54612 [Trichoplax adhaerens]EDV26519.1 hypothetical protein TRIADDRAFT_54612 [Trichoplax adhaerens]|eukprot:XP_002110515.1 hypothetical protein TRIADDRAFT_54612 [Trichoplax adhaerens]
MAEQLVKILLLFLTLIHIVRQESTEHYTNTWVIHVPGGLTNAKLVATTHASTILHQVGSLEDHYLIRHAGTPHRSKRSNSYKSWNLRLDTRVLYVEQQISKLRIKRSFPNFNDPLWPKQWYLENTGQASGPPHLDHNIIPAWKSGATGIGIVVSILDDGLYYEHPDLRRNYDPEASFDINGNDHDPTPRKTGNDENRHGTRCAGEVAAIANNSICTVGAAYNAKIGGIRMLDGDVTDAVEATSLSWKPQHIDIYSSSWGPEDDGRNIDGPGPLAKKAFIDGVNKGRHGLGSIFVWASGNGGSVHDNCNCDGYVISIYTISISAATDTGNVPWYTESCSSILATTFSSGNNGQNKIITDDLHDRCTESHTGTSAAAPLAAGMFALALEANPRLTWRDLQHIVVITSKPDKLHTDDWTINGVGRKISNWFGYGLLDAAALVSTARNWKTVPIQRSKSFKFKTKKNYIPPNGRLIVSINVEKSEAIVNYLEHVQAVISLSHNQRGLITIQLISPAGTKSVLFDRRQQDTSRAGFKNWPLMTTHFWGEKSAGNWTLIIINKDSNSGKLKGWKLVLFGTTSKPHDLYYSSCNPECERSSGCNGPGAADCRICRHFQAADGRCVKNCSNGQYGNLETKACINCPYGCDVCNNDSCITCKPNFANSNGSCVSSCPESTYQHSFNGNTKCLKCSSNCAACANETYCISCPGTAYEYRGSCIQQCPQGTYSNYVYGIRTCTSCKHNCLDCYGNEAGSCRVCQKGYQLVVDRSKCTKSCPVGYYNAISGEQNICLACHHRCTSCLSAASSGCKSCSHGFHLYNGSCTDKCPDGTYTDKFTGECFPCFNTCTTCNAGKSKSCLSCKSNLYLQNGECVSNCFKGYYQDDNLMRCRRCHHSCASCNGPSSNSCTSCKLSQSFLHNNSCLMECPVGHYSDITMKACNPCSSHCYHCVNSSVCLSCNKNFILHHQKCAKSCPSGYILKERTCNPCHPTCSNCSDDDIASCSGCKSHTHFLHQGICTKSCLFGYFGDTITQQCQPCHSSCASCFGEGNSSCLLCPLGRFLQHGSCVTTCNNGFPGKNGTCSSCEGVGCRECLPNDPNQCLTCLDNYFNHKFNCVRECPVGTYTNATAGQCLICHDSCNTCSGKHIENCTDCKPGWFMHAGKCVSYCPSGSYANGNACSKCSHGCKLCISQNTCLECESSLVKFNGSCLKDCPSNSYATDENTECQLCHKGCETCKIVNRESQCLSCINQYLILKAGKCLPNGNCSGNMYFNGSNCSKCHSDCEACFDDDRISCLRCREDKYLNPVSAICEQYCPLGYFADNATRRCQQCHYSCLSCSNASVCTQCRPGFYNSSGNCITKCASGEYFNNKTASCQLCGNNCKECNINSKTCITCKSGNYKYDGICLSACPTQTYASNGNCKACPSGCLECKADMTCTKCKNNYKLSQSACVLSLPNGCKNSSCLVCKVANCSRCSPSDSTICNICIKPFILHQGSCIKQCPDGTYFDHVKKNCFDCNDSCSSCVGPKETDCVKCSSAKPYLLHYKCLSKCPANYYIDNANAKCRQCHFSCKSCSGGSMNDCIICSDGFHYLKSEKQCVNKCPDLSYYRKNETDCGSCYSGCASCYGNEKDKCISCISPMVNFNFECMEKCPLGSYNDSGICRKCHPSCGSCTGPHLNQCTSCSTGLFLKNGECHGTCPSGYYEDMKSLKCLPCNPSCKTCVSDSAQCLTCNHGMVLQNSKCLRNCSSGYYHTDGGCRPCHTSCLSCKGFTASDCLSCSKGWELLPHGICEPVCPSGQYYDIGLKSCGNCHSSCATCSSKQSASCLSCLKGRLLDKQSSRCYPCCKIDSDSQCCNCSASLKVCVLLSDTGNNIVTTPSLVTVTHHDFGNTFKEEKPVQLILISGAISLLLFGVVVIIRCRRNIFGHRGYKKLTPSGYDHTTISSTRTAYPDYDNDEINQV